MDTAFAFETLQGAIIGIVFALGAFLITRLPKYQWLTASILCVVITPLALLPFWLSTGDLGISDWDYYLSMHTNIRSTITQFHQFPLWNPYTCGGTSALGDPEFPALSPLFLLEILFGTPAGLKLSIYVSTAIGALGMLHLARKLRIGVLGGLLASLGMAFGSVNLLEIVEGHQNILAAMYIPWVLFFWYVAYTSSNKKRTFATIAIAILLALMFFQGGIYLLMYMAGVFLILPFFVRNKKNAILITCLAGVLALGLASVKLIPVALWIQEFQDTAYASSAYTLANLDDIFLGRILYGAEDIIPNQGGGWHEYGAYLGPVVLVLALLGFIFNRKNRIVQTLLISAVLATLVSSLGPYLKPVFDQLSFIPRSNVSRIILFAVIPLSLLAGFGIESMQKKSRIMRVFALILLLLASVDIMSLAYPLASQAFVLPHVVHNIPQVPYPIAYSPFDYKTRYNGVDYTRAYDATLKGYGNLTYCSVLGPNPAVEIITDEGNKGILSFSDDKDATFEIESWTPNKAVFRTHTTQKTSAILNANYAKGWFVNGKPAKEIRNRPGVDVQPGNTILEFSYVPPGLKIGIIITSLTLLGILIYFARRMLRL
jgi:hypothetical protein